MIKTAIEQTVKQSYLFKAKSLLAGLKQKTEKKFRYGTSNMTIYDQHYNHFCISVYDVKAVWSVQHLIARKKFYKLYSEINESQLSK
ncbi:hypothetical protein T4D_3060 [Trichinella pseudospiralis]|uniref:Uncharacterized protein n=1 Tax=Trichinella pseudospiralis TaxID=6337 RepID=A0A0V1FGA8_TRIPS|nr:hypothetical protein T4D_3060 [Trichinella pseudospiralis]